VIAFEGDGTTFAELGAWVEPTRYERPPVDPADVAIVYSSGSAGILKGISYSMQGIVAMTFEWALMESALGARCLFCARVRWRRSEHFGVASASRTCWRGLYSAGSRSSVRTDPPARLTKTVTS
jgi:hypothetical protein